MFDIGCVATDVVCRYWELKVNILVAVKRVVDYNVKVRVKADQRGMELANVKMSMNPFDEVGVEVGASMPKPTESEIANTSI